MLELGIGADIFRAVAWALRALFVVLIVLALWRGRTWKLKIFYVTVTVLAFASPMFPEMARKRKYGQEYEKARAIFDERCKTAGEKIYKTADNVEGVFLLNVRPRGNRDADRFDPNWPDAALPDEEVGEEYIASFLKWEHQQRPPARGFLNNTSEDKNGFLVSPGYRHVDVKDKEGAMWRYTLSKAGDAGYPRPAKAELKGPSARYAVSYTNVGQPGDREHWVAGTTVTLTDTQTNEVMAEKTWYSFVPSLGTMGRKSTPWAYALTCPETKGLDGQAPTRFFTDQILKPKKGG